MKATLLALLGIIVGITVAFVLVIAVEAFGAVAHPTPPDFDENSMEQMCAHVARFPHWVLGVVVPMWSGTALISTWIAAKIGRTAAGMAVGLFLLAFVVFNVAVLPYPVWFKAVTPLCIAVVSGLATWAARSRVAPPAPQPQP